MYFKTTLSKKKTIWIVPYVLTLLLILDATSTNKSLHLKFWSFIDLLFIIIIINWAFLHMKPLQYIANRIT